VILSKDIICILNKFTENLISVGIYKDKTNIRSTFAASRPPYRWLLSEESLGTIEQNSG